MACTTGDSWVRKYSCSCGSRFAMPLREAVAETTAVSREQTRDMYGPEAEDPLFWFLSTDRRLRLNPQLALLLSELIDNRSARSHTDCDAKPFIVTYCFVCAGLLEQPLGDTGSVASRSRCECGHAVAVRYPRITVGLQLGPVALDVIPSFNALRRVANLWLTDGGLLERQLPMQLADTLRSAYQI